MQFLMVVAAMFVAAAMLAFTGSTPEQKRAGVDAPAELVSFQIDTYAKAAWAVAHSGRDGIIDRSELILPPSFADDPNAPLQARAEDGFVYVWVEHKANAFRPEQILPGADYTVGVGLLNGDQINMRDGAVVSRPGWISPSNGTIVVRIKA